MSGLCLCVSVTEKDQVRLDFCLYFVLLKRNVMQLLCSAVGPVMMSHKMHEGVIQG